jgi:hypothetical protein
VRAASDIGDELGVSAVDDTGKKSYPLSRIPNNVSYETVSEQPEAEPNQPLAIPLSFHGGLAYSTYDERQAGAFVSTGMIVQEPNIIRPPIVPTKVTLTDAANPPMYGFEALAPNATIAFDAASDASDSTVTSLTWEHTVGSGDDRLLRVGLSNVPTPGPDTVTYGGTALTYAGNHPSNGSQMQIWFLVAPATGAANIVATYSGATRDIVGGADSWTNVDQAKPVGSFVAASGSSSPATVDVSSASGEVVVGCLVVGNVTATVGASQTQRWNVLEGTTIRGAGSSEPGAGTVTMSWTLGSSSNWALGAIALKPAKLPVLYAISVEDGEVNVYKISLAAANFGTLLNTKTFVVDTTQPMGHPAEWNDGSNTLWRLGLGDNGKIQKLTTIAGGTSDDTWTASADADARHLKVVGNQLIRSTDENQISILPRGSDPNTEANWGGDFFAGDVSSNITELGEAGGLGYIAKEDGFYEWDLIGEAQNVFPDIQQAERNGQGMVYWHGGFMIPASSGLWWTLTGEPEGPDSNPENRANDPSLGSTDYFKHGRWMGGATFGAYTYRLYVSSAGTTAFLTMIRERKETDPPGPMPLISQVIALPSADFNDFHGVHITETSKFSASETRPCLWYADGNDLRYIWLDKDGAPLSRRGDIGLMAVGSVTSGRIDGGMPNVPKQLWAIEGWAEDFGSVVGAFRFSVYRDGGSLEDPGSTISSDGFFRQFWTQDSNDTARTLLVQVRWVGNSNLTNTNGPHLRDVVLRVVALPRTSREWMFLFDVADQTGRTAKKIRSELEGYVGDLKKYTLPGRDTFNGIMGKPRMLRADEISALTPRNQEPPEYVIAAPVIEKAGS